MVDRREPELPTLDDGVTLLETDETTGALHALALDELLVGDGHAAWVDARGRGTTEPLARVAPSPRLLERVRIARAFTPWQHLALLRRLADATTDRTALAVLPAFDAFYRDGDAPAREAERLLAEAVSVVADLAADFDGPVVLTRTRDDDLSAPVARLADDVVACDRTPFGPRFVGDEFETLVYPVDGGVQTTLAFWARVLEDRQRALAPADAPTGVSALGSH